MQLIQPQITFYGAIFTAQGMKPDLAKIQDLPTPENHKQLQTFLGLINYLQSFCTSSASKTTFLREKVCIGTETLLQMQHFINVNNGYVKQCSKGHL